MNNYAKLIKWTLYHLLSELLSHFFLALQFFLLAVFETEP